MSARPVLSDSQVTAFTMFDGAVDLCLVDVSFLGEEAAFDTCLSRVSPLRREKVLRYKVQSGRSLSLGAGLALDYLLSRYGLREQDMEYETGENEKPFFKDHPGLLFNLSHSGNQALACLCRKTAVYDSLGCDIQIMKPDAMMSIAKHFFHPDEIQLLLGCETPSRQADVFYRLWTLKESILKATGMGLALPMSEVCFDLSEGSASCRWNRPGIRYLFEEKTLPGSALACCLGVKRAEA